MRKRRRQAQQKCRKEKGDIYMRIRLHGLDVPASLTFHPCNCVKMW